MHASLRVRAGGRFCTIVYWENYQGKTMSSSAKKNPESSTSICKTSLITRIKNKVEFQNKVRWYNHLSLNNGTGISVEVCWVIALFSFLLYRTAILLGTPTLELFFPTLFISWFMWKMMAFIQHTGVNEGASAGTRWPFRGYGNISPLWHSQMWPSGTHLRHTLS